MSMVRGNVFSYTSSALIFSSIADLLGKLTRPLMSSAYHLACVSDMVRIPPDAGCTNPIKANDWPISGLNTFLNS